VRASHPEDIWLEKGPQYAAPVGEVQQALASCLVADWRTVWDKNTWAFGYPQIGWYLNHEAGLLAWADYAANFQLKQTGNNAFTAEDYYQFHLFDEIKRIGKEALADDYFRHFREYEFATKNQEFFQDLGLALTNKGRRPNLEFLWFCFLWDRQLIPLQFWNNDAIAGYYRTKADDDGTRFNKERIRDWKRALNLKETPPLLGVGWDDAKKRIKLERRIEVLKRIDEIHGIPIPRLPVN
jgi:hypothetical protein